jgi:hypothetical protein
MKQSPFFDVQRGKTSHNQMRNTGRSTPLSKNQRFRDQLRITLPICNEDNIFDDNRIRTNGNNTKRKMS